jgi:uncharacterized protein YndB with AHSA1/START domain
MLKWLLITLLVLVALVVVVAAVGYLLPQDHVASRSARYPRPPEAVFDVIHDVGAAASWRPDVRRVELLPPVDGRVRFREESRSGGITMEIVEASRPTRMVTGIADPGQPFGGTWTFELTPDGNGTRLTITERGEIYNVLFRALARFVFGYTSTLDAYLEALGQKVGVSTASS